MRGVYVCANDRSAERDLRNAASNAGFMPRREPSLQALSSLLYRDPRSMALLRISTADLAVKICREYRAAEIGNLIFVLVDKQKLTALNAIDRARVLRAGADDAQVAPIAGEEITARLSALARRGPYRDHLRIVMPGCVFDASEGLLETEIGGEVRLSKTLAKLFSVLAMQPERTLSKSALMDALYGDDDPPEEKIVDVLICKLRAQLKRALTPGTEVIRTVWGRGYFFMPEGFTPKFRDNVRVAR